MRNKIRLTESDLNRIVKKVIKEQLDADYQKQIQDLTNITNSPSGQKAAADYRKGQRDLENKRKREKEKLEQDAKNRMYRLYDRTNIIDLFKKMGLVEGYDNLSKIGLQDDAIKTIKQYAGQLPVYSTRNLVVWSTKDYTYVVGKFPRQKNGDIYLSCKSTGYQTQTVKIQTNRTGCMIKDIMEALYSQQELDKMATNIR